MEAFGGGGSSDRIELRGENPEVLDLLARQIKQRLERAFENEIQYISYYSPPGDPELEVRSRPQMLSQWQLTMQDMSSVVWMTRRGGDEQLVPFRNQDQDINILIRTKDSKSRSIEDLERMRIRTPEAQYVELAELAEIKIAESSRRITRTNQQHEISLRFRLNRQVVRSSSRLEIVEDQIDEVLAAVQLPPGYTMKIVHRDDEQDNSMRWAMIASVVCVFLFLAALFEDIGTPICVMATFPMALIGALWGFVITQTNPATEQMVWIGLLMLVGIVVNDAILSLGQARHLMTLGYDRTRAVLEGGRNRFRPVMMTTATTVLGMLPLAIRRGGENEMWPPFAITVIFGLLASTVFTLGFVPALYLSLGDITKWLKSLRIWGLTIAAGSTAAFVYFGLMRAGWVEGWIWRIILTPTLFFTFCTIIWIAIRSVTYVKHKSIFQDEDLHITIRNLTKHYGSDGPLVRDLKFKERREASAIKRGEPIVVKSHIREDFIWKIPAYALILYFHNYFEFELWRFFIGCVSWLALYDFIIQCGKLVEGSNYLALNQLPSRVRRFFWKSCERIPTILLAVYIYLDLNAQLWVAILLLILGLALQWIRDIALESRRSGIPPETGHSIAGKLKGLALRIPIIAGVKPQVHALTGVNLEIGKGMFGLLGPNGAGKTTLMRILCNIYEPNHGCIEINGRNTKNLRGDVQPILGYLPQHFGLYENFTVYEYLTYYAMLNDIFDKKECDKLTDKVIHDVNLEDRKDSKISSLSGGMRQRVGIAQTLIHLPKIIVVDEPTAGLDPIERIRFRNLLAELSKDRIVIFSTHITEDVMSACHQLAVLKEGRVVVTGTPEELVDVADGKVHEVVIEPAKIGELMEEVHIISQVTEEGGIRVRYVETEEHEIESEIVEPTLEDAYIYLLRTAGETA
jgi:ABC-type multidrug transport system ATPase subunit/preprotein translocase subunit SecF